MMDDAITNVRNRRSWSYSTSDYSCELFFEDWTWRVQRDYSAMFFYGSEPESEEVLKPTEAIDCITCEVHVDPAPSEAVFHRRRPVPFIVRLASKQFRFDPKGWELPYHIEVDSLTVWFFRNDDHWLVIEDEGSDGRFFPKAYFASSQEVADRLLLAGKHDVDSELVRHTSIQTLCPESAGKIHCGAVIDELFGNLDSTNTEQTSIDPDDWLHGKANGKTGQSNDNDTVVAPSISSVPNDDIDDRTLVGPPKPKPVVYLVDRKEIGAAFGDTERKTVHTWVTADWFPAKYSTTPERWRSDEVSKAMGERPKAQKKQTKDWSKVCSSLSILVE